MNWRTIVGTILTILGVRGLYIAFHAPAVPKNAMAATVLWTIVGLYFMMKGIFVKNEKSL